MQLKKTMAFLYQMPTSKPERGAKLKRNSKFKRRTTGFVVMLLLLLKQATLIVILGMRNNQLAFLFREVARNWIRVSKDISMIWVKKSPWFSVTLLSAVLGFSFGKQQAWRWHHSILENGKKKTKNPLKLSFKESIQTFGPDLQPPLQPPWFVVMFLRTVTPQSNCSVLRFNAILNFCKKEETDKIGGVTRYISVLSDLYEPAA